MRSAVCTVWTCIALVAICWALYVTLWIIWDPASHAQEGLASPHTTAGNSASQHQLAPSQPHAAHTSPTTSHMHQNPQHPQRNSGRNVVDHNTVDGHWMRHVSANDVSSIKPFLGQGFSLSTLVTFGSKGAVLFKPLQGPIRDGQASPAGALAEVVAFHLAEVLGFHRTLHTRLLALPAQALSTAFLAKSSALRPRLESDVLVHALPMCAAAYLQAAPPRGTSCDSAPPWLETSAAQSASIEPPPAPAPASASVPVPAPSKSGDSGVNSGPLVIMGAAVEFVAAGLQEVATPDGCGVSATGDSRQEYSSKCDPAWAPEYIDVAFFDLLIGNTDRHTGGNLFLSPLHQRQLLWMDHGGGDIATNYSVLPLFQAAPDSYWALQQSLTNAKVAHLQGLPCGLIRPSTRAMLERYTLQPHALVAALTHRLSKYDHVQLSRESYDRLVLRIKLLHTNVQAWCGEA